MASATAGLTLPTGAEPADRTSTWSPARCVRKAAPIWERPASVPRTRGRRAPDACRAGRCRCGRPLRNGGHRSAGRRGDDRCGRHRPGSSGSGWIRISGSSACEDAWFDVHQAREMSSVETSPGPRHVVAAARQHAHLVPEFQGRLAAGRGSSARPSRAIGVCGSRRIRRQLPYQSGQFWTVNRSRRAAVRSSRVSLKEILRQCGPRAYGPHIEADRQHRPATVNTTQEEAPWRMWKCR